MSGTGEGISVQEAARILDTSVNGVRKRLRRGSLPGVKDERGEWLVLIASPPAQARYVQTPTRPDAEKPIPWIVPVPGGTGAGAGSAAVLSLVVREAVREAVEPLARELRETGEALGRERERADRLATDLAVALHERDDLLTRITENTSPMSDRTSLSSATQQHEGWGARFWRWLAGEAPHKATGD